MQNDIDKKIANKIWLYQLNIIADAVSFCIVDNLHLIKIENIELDYWDRIKIFPLNTVSESRNIVNRLIRKKYLENVKKDKSKRNTFQRFSVTSNFNVNSVLETACQMRRLGMNLDEIKKEMIEMFGEPEYAK